MTEYQFNTNKYYTLKDVYTNLCVTRNSIVKKIEKLEKNGYILRVKNKRPSIYITKEGYEVLRKERIEYLENQINNSEIKEYYIKLKEAIGHPELWDKYHNNEVHDIFYYNQGELMAVESKKDGRKSTCAKK